MVEIEYLDIDVSKIIKLQKAHDNLPRGILSLSQISKILSSPDINTPMGLRNKTILEVLYCTGIRNFELRNLKMKHVDTTRCEIYIDHGKGGQSRIVPTGKICADFIEQYITKSRPYLIRFNPDQDNLFVTHNGKNLTGNNISAIVKNICKKVGIKENITPHSLRHTYATHLLRNKAPLRHIQTLLGHKTILSTQVYTRVEISDLQKIHQKCHPRA